MQIGFDQDHVHFVMTIPPRYAADNVCKISTRNIIKQSKITLEQALELKKQKPHDAIFYQMIADYLQNFS